MLAQSCSQLTTNNIYKLDFNIFQVPEGVIPPDMIHHMDHKMTQTLKIPILNTNNTISNLGKNSSIATLVPAGRCKHIQEVKLSEVT